MRKLLEKYNNIPQPLRASFWFLVCGICTKGISIITTPIFTRLLTAVEYGKYSQFMSWYGIISVIVSLNLCSGVYSRGLVVFENRRDEFSSTMQGLTLLLCLFWTGVYLIGHNIWNDLLGLTTIQMILMMGLIWLNAVFQFWALEQRVEYKYKKLVVITTIMAVLQPLLGIILVLTTRDKITARIMGMVIPELFIYLSLFFVQMNKGKKIVSIEFWKYALSFNIPLIPHYISIIVLNSSDRIMIGKMIGDDKAGIYNLAYSIAQIMIIFNSALIQTFEPWLFKRIKNNEVNQISNMAMPTFVFVAFINILLILFAPELVNLFAPEEYQEAVWIIPPIAMSVFFMYLYTFFSVFEFYYKKTKYVMIATTIGAMANIILNYFCIDKYGYYAAGYTTLVCYMFFAAFHYVFMRLVCKKYLNSIKPYDEKLLFGIVICFILFGGVLQLTYLYSMVRYAILFIMIIVAVICRKKIKNMIMSIYNIKK